ncbi:MAG TPA: hypothetical protein VKJ47_20730 [Candidatus Binatia bacterium]|nr:hypothetical protein [Candidatus Binatia bacterium]
MSGKRRELGSDSHLAMSISPIIAKDISLYRQFFSRDGRASCYGNSWTYITQACRGLGLGYKYYDGDVLLSIGRHNGHYVIVRPLGTIDHRFLDLLRFLARASYRPVFVKKLFPDQVATLRHLGDFCPASAYAGDREQAVPGKYVWDGGAFADDDTYPELIYDIDLSSALELERSQWLAAYRLARADTPGTFHGHSPSRYHYELRRRVRQFSNLSIHCRLEEYHAGMEDGVRRFCADYFGVSRRENAAAYENTLKLPQVTDCENHFFRFVAFVDGSSAPSGFFVVERLDRLSAGSYASIISRRYPSLPEYLTTRVMQQLKGAGVRYLNVGGSESHGLHMFKKKYGPIEARTMAMLVYGTRS